MTVEFQDVLKAELVLIGFRTLTNAKENEAFRAAVKTDVVASGHSVTIDSQTNIAESGRIISLNRDRIILDISASRSTIRREYPEEKDIERLAEVAGLVIAQSTSEDQELRAFGYNLELVYDQKSGQTAAQYLADRLLSNNLPRRNEWELVGGAGKVTYKEGENQWQITIEPRLNEPGTTKIFLNLNLHKDEHALPSESDIRDSLKEAWRQAHKFAYLLDKGEM